MLDENLLSVSGLKVGFRDTLSSGEDRFVDVIRDLSFAIKEKEICALIGTSGCGKTTLIKAMIGLLDPIGGNIEFSDKNDPSLIWYAPQTPLLIDFRTVEENILLSRELRRNITITDREECDDIIKKIGLEESRFKPPNELSGGMRRRVSLAQALFSESKFLLLDEPFAELDLSTRLRAEKTVEAIVRQSHKTVLMASHDIDSVARLSDRVLVMAGAPYFASQIVAIDKLFLPEENTVQKRQKTSNLRTAMDSIYKATLDVVELKNEN